MNKIWLVSTALVAALASGSAFAADLPPAPQVYAPAPPPPPRFSWTGCYLGIDGGGIWGRSQHIAASSANAGLAIENPFEVSGGVFGGEVGCNYQISSLVVGVANDFSWTNATGSRNDIAPFNLAAVSTTDQSWLDTLRGRAGFAWERFYFYGTGGAAFSNVGVTVCSPGGCISDSQTRTGWTAGVGAEWAAWPVPVGTLTFKVEYLHADLGTGRFVNPPFVFPTGGTVVTRDVKLTDEIFRGGVNWKFDWW
jgi:outer membrane immunogenic protein